MRAIVTEIEIHIAVRRSVFMLSTSSRLSLGGKGIVPSFSGMLWDSRTS
jgi:hypothetical protein